MPASRAIWRMLTAVTPFSEKLIATDLHNSGEATRARVARVISELGETYELQESLWIAYSNSTKDEIGKRVWEVMNKRDRLLVTNIGGVYHSGRNQSLNQYLTQHMNQR